MSLAVLLALAVSPQAAGLAGRWDLTVRVGDTLSHPAWLEVVSRNGRLEGRFQGRTGHAMAIEQVAVSGAGFKFVWPDDENPKAKPIRVEGTVEGSDRIAGAMIDSTGQRFAFTGRRAPSLERAPSAFGPPIDLLTTGLEAWRIRDPREKNGWTVVGGVLTNTPPSADLVTRRLFRDFRLRLEVNVPPGGNSGIYLRGRHEVQVEDSYGKAPQARGMGGIYGQVTPASVPAKKPGEWQTFDITLVGRRVTVVLNGVTVLDRAEIPGITGGALDSDEGAPGPLMLQGDHTGVRYRNIVIQPALRP